MHVGKQHMYSNSKTMLQPQANQTLSLRMNLIKLINCSKHLESHALYNYIKFLVPSLYILYNFNLWSMPRYVSIRFRKQWLQPPWTSLAFNGNIKGQISSGRATQAMKPKQKTRELGSWPLQLLLGKNQQSNPAVEFTKSAGLDEFVMGLSHSNCSMPTTIRPVEDHVSAMPHRWPVAV